MGKNGNFQSPVSALMAVDVLKRISKCKNASVESLKKDVADAFDLINRAFDAYDEGVANAKKKCAKQDCIVDENRSAVKNSSKVDEDLLKSRCEDIDEAFNAYNRYVVITAKHSGRKVPQRHLAKIAKCITRICLSDVEGLDLDNIETEISGMEKGEGKLSIIVKTFDDEKD